MDTKHWSQSKTILFNVLVAVLTVLGSQDDALRGLLSEGGYLGLTLFITVANTYLRTVTTTTINASGR